MATLAGTTRRNDHGQAVIELALTLPLLLIVVFGIIDFGFMFQRYEAVTNAAREGARLGVLPNYTAEQAQNRALDYLRASGLNGTLRATTSCDNNAAAEVRDTMCARMTEGQVVITGTDPPRTVNQVRMVVEYDHEYSFLGPMLRLIGGSGWGTIRLRAVSTMRKE